MLGIKTGNLVIADFQENDIRYRTWQKLSIYAHAKHDGISLSHPTPNETYLVIDVVCLDMIYFINKSHYRQALVGQKFVRCLSSAGTCYVFPAATLKVLQ
jgi:hypothetical protein